MRETTLRIATFSESPTLPRTPEEVRRASVLLKVADSCRESGAFSVIEGAEQHTYLIRTLPSGNYLISPRSFSRQGAPQAEPTDSSESLSFQRIYQERAAFSVTITPEGRIVTPNLDDSVLQTRHEALIQRVDRALESRHDGLISELIG